MSTIDDEMLRRGAARAKHFTKWAKFASLTECRECGDEAYTTFAAEMTNGDLFVTTLCREHAAAAEELLRDIPQKQGEQKELDRRAKESQ
jgi:hypothetical protein